MKLLLHINAADIPVISILKSSLSMILSRSVFRLHVSKKGPNLFKAAVLDPWSPRWHNCWYLHGSSWSYLEPCQPRSWTCL